MSAMSGRHPDWAATPLVVESLLPMAYDASTPQGREGLGLTGLDDVRFEPFRLRPGDDTSCLNLYQPTSPRVLGVRDAFVQSGRFRFGRTLAETPAERANPWTLLARTFADGATPVIADANSLAYVLHKNVGEDIVVETGRTPVRLRVVAALADTVFQREVLIHESAFVRLFPEQEGYRFLLAEAPPGRVADAAVAIEDRLAPFAADAVPAAERLAEFHRVENTYLATFQMLGGLGLLLGTVGLAAVLLRNVVERRRDLALFSAVGFEPRHIRTMLLAESVSLLVTGLVVGVASAAVATLPAVIERGGRMPVSLTGVLLVGMVLVSGTLGHPARGARRDSSTAARRASIGVSTQMPNRILITLATLMALSSVPVLAQNWPHWRGPSMNGISTETGVPMKWSKTENVAWTLPMPAPVRIDADRVGRPHLSERRRRGQPVPLERQPDRWGRPLEAAARRGRQGAAQGQQLDAVAGDRRPHRLGDHGQRHPQGVRLRRQGTVDAGSAEGLRRHSASSSATAARRCSTRARSISRCCTASSRTTRRTS